MNIDETVLFPAYAFAAPSVCDAPENKNDDADDAYWLRSLLSIFFTTDRKVKFAVANVILSVTFFWVNLHIVCHHSITVEERSEVYYGKSNLKKLVLSRAYIVFKKCYSIKFFYHNKVSRWTQAICLNYNAKHSLSHWPVNSSGIRQSKIY